MIAGLHALVANMIQEAAKALKAEFILAFKYMQDILCVHCNARI